MAADNNCNNTMILVSIHFCRVFPYVLSECSTPVNVSVVRKRVFLCGRPDSTVLVSSETIDSSHEREDTRRAVNIYIYLYVLMCKSTPSTVGLSASLMPSSCPKRDTVRLVVVAPVASQFQHPCIWCHRPFLPTWSC